MRRLLLTLTFDRWNFRNYRKFILDKISLCQFFSPKYLGNKTSLVGILLCKKPLLRFVWNSLSLVAVKCSVWCSVHSRPWPSISISCYAIRRGVKSTEMLYSSKSTITLMKFYLSTSTITHLKIYSSKSKK